MYPDNRQRGEIDGIHKTLDLVLQNLTHPEELNQALLQYAIEAINNLTLGTAVTLASGIGGGSASAEPSSAYFP